MIGGTVCSGIGAPETAAPWIDWRWGAEIDRHAGAVLAARHPGVRNLGDMTRITRDGAEPVDVIVAGTPCQDFSVAGLRAGLAGERGNLTLEFVRLLGELRPTWFVLENVPGLLSMDEGRAFGAILGAVAELGYGTAYRVLDAQYAGVAQRRERVFVVGYLGDWRPPAAVLFERESLRRDPPPRREAGKDIAGTLRSRSGGGCGPGPDDAKQGLLVVPTLLAGHNRSGGDRPPGTTVDTAESLIAFGGNNGAGPIDAVTACNAHGGTGRLDFESETFVVAPPLTGNPYGDHESREGLMVAHALRAEGFDAGEDGTGRGTPLVAFTAKDYGADASEIAPTLRAMEFDKSHANGGGQIAIALHENQRAEITLNDTAGSLKVGGGKPGQGYPAVAVAIRGRDAGAQIEVGDGIGHAVRASQGGSDKPHVFDAMGVRRLTPIECERLQGFPDGYTQVPWRGKPMADGPRYRMLGNAMAVPVIGWVLARVAMVHRHLRHEAGDGVR